MKVKGATDNTIVRIRVVKIECCETCLFWMLHKGRPAPFRAQGFDSPGGFCRRYPEARAVLGESWCGEWKNAEDVK